MPSLYRLISSASGKTYHFKPHSKNEEITDCKAASIRS